MRYRRIPADRLIAETYVIEFDIKGFFDNVNHSKLIKQLWAMGFRDRHLLWVLKRILKTPIRMLDRSVFIPQKGTPQGGIISPLLANVVLNELDHWIEGQWQQNPVIKNYKVRINANGSEDHGNAYSAMKKTRLNIDCAALNRAVMTVLTNRLRTQKGSRLAKEFTTTRKRGKPPETERSGRILTKMERDRYAKKGKVTAMMRWVRGSGEPIYPIGYVQCKNPMYYGVLSFIMIGMRGIP